MNNGAFGENFPYSNFHDLNMDWIIKIAKDFLDQYTHIQETIDNGLDALDEKATNLEALLQEWYDTHSQDIADQLADALADLNAWYTQHENYLDQTLATNISTFDTHAEQKAYQTVASIPSDYATLSNDVAALNQSMDDLGFHHISSINDFNPGTLSFSGAAPSWQENAGYKYIALYDVSFIRITTTSAKFYLKVVPVDTGIISNTVTVQPNTVYESAVNGQYYITYDTSTGTVFDLVYSKFINDYKDNYVDKYHSLFNCSLTTISNITNLDYAASYTNIRVSTNKIKSNRLHIKSNTGYQTAVFAFNGTDIVLAHNYAYGEYWVYNSLYEYLVVAIKKYDNTAITKTEALNNVEIRIENLTDSPTVVYFTTTVPINGTDYEDHGILVLPGNYDPYGDPLRLCIVCHGAGASYYEPQYTVMDETGKIIGDPQRVLTKKGYAVMDCYASPYDYVGHTASTAGLHYGNPSVVTCYQKAYEYVCNNFNVKKDGILLFGSSMGGLSISQIVNNSNIPVLSAVGYCPCLDMYKQAWSNTWASQQRMNIARLFGFEGTEPTWTNGWSNLTEEEKQYFIDNFEKVNGFYPILYNATTGSFDEIKSYFPSGASGPSPTEEAIYNNFRAFYKVPLLIIHCENDPTMAERYSQYFVNMLRKNGQRAFIKTFETGGHGAWAAGSDVTTRDIYGETFTCKESQLDGLNFAKQFDR